MVPISLNRTMVNGEIEEEELRREYAEEWEEMNEPAEETKEES